jgi:hypothetical protein
MRNDDVLDDSSVSSWKTRALAAALLDRYVGLTPECCDIEESREIRFVKNEMTTHTIVVVWTAMFGGHTREIILRHRNGREDS